MLIWTAFHLALEAWDTYKDDSFQFCGTCRVLASHYLLEQKISPRLPKTSKDRLPAQGVLYTGPASPYVQQAKS